LEASLGLAYPIDQNDANLALYRTSATAFEWKVKMRYYTAINQANPTPAGQHSDVFTLTISELQYDPCNDNTLAGATQVADQSYAWSSNMAESDKFVDLVANTYTTTLNTCVITTSLQVQDPTTQAWTTVTSLNRYEYPFVFNVASTGALATIYADTTTTENTLMAKYLDANTGNFVIAARWMHQEAAWLETDKDTIYDDFTITFSFAIGDVCAENQISLGQPSVEKKYDVPLTAGTTNLLEIPRGTIQRTYSRCGLTTIVEV
jgi:hypothetical protein